MITLIEMSVNQPLKHHGIIQKINQKLLFLQPLFSYWQM